MSTAAHAVVDPAAVRAALDGVPDPEMPAISIVELGMLVDLRVDGGRVEVDLVPTFSGCPAIPMIREQAAAAVAALPGVQEVEVAFTHAQVWTPERIASSAHAKLRAFGIAPPGSGQGPELLQIGRRPTPVTCPLCGSSDTVADSPFGPTPCRSSSWCNSCRNPFEVIKP